MLFINGRIQRFKGSPASFWSVPFVLKINNKTIQSKKVPYSYDKVPPRPISPSGFREKGDRAVILIVVLEILLMF